MRVKGEGPPYHRGVKGMVGLVVGEGAGNTTKDRCGHRIRASQREAPDEREGGTSIEVECGSKMMVI